MTMAVIAELKAGLSPSAAILFEQIEFWHPKAQAHWGGRRFWAQTRKELRDRTGLKEWALRKAIEELKSKGRIET